MTASAAAKRYTPADICRATGFTVPQQNQHIARHTIIPSCYDSKPTGTGDVRLTSSETAYQFAIFGKCTELGIQARRAAEAARLFAVEQPGRQASAVFEFGRTLLVVKTTGPQIVNVDYDASLSDIFGRPMPATIIIDIGQVIDEVNVKLSSLKGKK
jgi:hypothetical protein